jgi:phosphatidylglycerol lysyltransferase
MSELDLDPSSLEEGVAGAPTRKVTGRASLRRFLPLVAPLLIGFGLWFLHAELARFRYADLVQYLRSFPLWKLFLALTLTAAGYLTLTAYDVLAFRYLRRDLPYRRIALAGFIGYAFSNNINAFVSGIPLRFRLYTAWGVSAGEMGRVFAFTILGFWLGFLSLSGVTFTLFPQALPAGLRLPFITDRPLGIACLILIGAYLAANFLSRPSLRVWRWDVSLPGPGWSLAQIAIASLDWSLAAAVLFVALPAGSGLSYPGFLGLFLLAQFLGLLSQSPGGLGVFDTAIVLLLAPALPAAEVLGALLVYRAIYYFLPLTVAGLLLATFEIYQRRERLGQVAGAVGRWVPLVVPRVMSVLVFLGGTVLLISGATPAVGSRLGWLDDLLPLPVIELSHFLGSLAGILLLLLARGLQRRIDAAYHLTVGLLTLGIVVSLLKGLDWEEASLLALMLVALVPCRREFYRRSALVREPFTPAWVAAISAVLLAVVWLGVFAHQHLEYSGELWWRFELSADAPRALRAMVGVLIVLFLVGATRLLRPAAPEPSAPTTADLDAAEVVARASRRSSAYLALLGDKRLLFNEDKTAFVMYATEGRSWIAMGDPVGLEAAGTELGWRFQSICQRHGGWPVFYQVEESRLGRYVEMGLSLMKLGEEARVPLEGFSLEGPRRAELRQALRRAAREGAGFVTVPREEVRSLVPELAAVSDAWLREKKGAEKGFSLGFFDAEYLCRCPLALVRKEGRIVAFANLWPGGEKEELSIDLMRYDPTAGLHGVMDYLFTSLMVWGAAEGYRWFNLGMAPLAGLDERQEGPLWNRLGAFIFRHGENFYNFEGLRRFKDKFEPIWEPRYLAVPAGLALPAVLRDLVALISQGSGQKRS